MKLEIKKDMYIRTKDGIIDKVIFGYYGHCASRNCDCKHISCAKNYYDEDKVVKASYNIIDILEVGDYVNGYKVEEVNNNLNEHKGICNSLDTYLWLVNDLDEFEEIVIFEKDIKSIVTKKQFESMEYRIGDE